jgi:hypothetical protein
MEKGHVFRSSGVTGVQEFRSSGVADKISARGLTGN